MFSKSRFGQGALEYLLMIGAAILIVAVVIIALSGIVFETKDQNSISDYNSQMDKLQDLQKKPNLNEDLSVARVISFSVDGISGTIKSNTIELVVPEGTDLSSVSPLISIRGATVSPASGVAQNFNNPVTYTVTSKDSNTVKTYTVIVNYYVLDVPIVPVDDTVIRLTDCNGLQNVKNNLDANYVLMNDIDCRHDTSEGGILWNEGLGFEPIGSVLIDEEYNVITSPFNGIFDGNGFKIIGLYFNRDYLSLGLFEVTGSKSIIRNLGLVDENIFGLNSTIGGLVGLSFGTVEKVSVENISIKTNSEYFEGIGGLIGMSYGNLIKNCYVNNGIIEVISSGSDNYGVGGLVGFANDNYYWGDPNYFGVDFDDSKEIVVENSYANLKINAPGVYMVGALIGEIKEGIVRNNYSKGEVNGSQDVGGLIGASYNSVIANNYSVSEVNGSQDVGGLIGYSRESTIENNYSIKKVSGSNYVGGLIGQDNKSNINGNFTVSEVNSTGNYSAGMVGYLSNSEYIDSSNYFDNVLTKKDCCYFLNGECGWGCSYNSDYNMQYFYKENYPLAYWDFSEGGNWKLQEKNYPILAWEDKEGYFDTIPPQVILLTPINESTLNSFDVKFSFSVSDSEKIKYCTIKSGSNSHTWSSYWGYIENGVYEIIWQVDKGVNDWNVVCVDSSDNFSEIKSSSFNVDQLTYNISNCVELQGMKNDLSGKYVLLNDIYCDETKEWNFDSVNNYYKGFEPIGVADQCEKPHDFVYINNKYSCEYSGFVWFDRNLFKGEFVSNGHRIFDLYINRPNLMGVGLFGATNTESGFNGIKLNDVNIIGKYSVGGLVGENNRGNLNNNYVSGSIKGIETVGGLVGRMGNNNIESNDVNIIVVSDGGSIGGLVGSISGADAIITNNSIVGFVNGVAYVGGLIGYLHNVRGVLKNSFKGELKGLQVGGLVGKLYNNYDFIENNFVDANIYEREDMGIYAGVWDRSAGGLIGGVGHNYGESIIKNNYVKGNLFFLNADYIGGLIGHGGGGNIINNYSAMNVSGNDAVGGLIGFGDSLNVMNNFVVGNLSGSSKVGGLIGERWNQCWSEYDSETGQYIEVGCKKFQNNYYLNGTSCCGSSTSDQECDCTKVNSLDVFFVHNGINHPVYYGDEPWDNNWFWTWDDLPKFNWQ